VAAGLARSKVTAIEGMRGLAALYVMLGHIFTLADPLMKSRRPNSGMGIFPVLAAPFWYGHLAVAAFITISGYCLQLALFGRSNGRFAGYAAYLKRRLRRILPPYYACLGLSIVVCVFVTSQHEGMPWSQYLPLSNSALVTHALLIHNFSPDWMYKINGVLWSIAIEFQLYFVLPVFVAIMWRWGSMALMVLSSAVAWGLLVMVPGGSKLYFWYIALFCLGIVAARLANESSTKWLKPSQLAALGVVAFVAAGWLASQQKAMVGADACVAIAVACWMALATLDPSSRWCAWLASKPLAVVGAFSYSIYLVHHPLLQVAVHVQPAAVSTPLRQAAYLLACAPLILAIIWAFHCVFERPFMGGRKASA